MHSESNAQIIAQPADSLVLETLPNGQCAWLRPRRIVDTIAQARVNPAAPSGYLTDLGRRALAMEALFGPWVNAAGRRTWTDPHQKPGDLCGRVWACGESAHHHNCSECEAHCRLGITAQDHENADQSDRYHVAHCRCAFCVARRDGVA